jgi:hypothetical protein
VPAAPVAAIVGQRVTILIKPQSLTMPCVTLQEIAISPENDMRGWSGVDGVQVQLDAWAATRDTARDLATKCRTALSSANRLMVGQFEDFESDVDLYRITQTWETMV